jgi:hypothetical protein
MAKPELQLEFRRLEEECKPVQCDDPARTERETRSRKRFALRKGGGIRALHPNAQDHTDLANIHGLHNQLCNMEETGPFG